MGAPIPKFPERFEFYLRVSDLDDVTKQRIRATPGPPQGGPLDDAQPGADRWSLIEAFRRNIEQSERQLDHLVFPFVKDRLLELKATPVDRRMRPFTEAHFMTRDACAMMARDGSDPRPLMAHMEALAPLATAAISHEERWAALDRIIGAMVSSEQPIPPASPATALQPGPPFTGPVHPIGSPPPDRPTRPPDRMESPPAPTPIARVSPTASPVAVASPAASPSAAVPSPPSPTPPRTVSSPERPVQRPIAAASAAPVETGQGPGSPTVPVSPASWALALVVAAAGGGAAFLAFRRRSSDSPGKKTPAPPQRYLAMGLHNLKKGEYERAIARFQSALAANEGRRDEILAYVALAIAKQGHRDIVQEEIKKLNVESVPKELVYELALACESVGLADESQRLLNRVYIMDIGYKDVAKRIKKRAASSEALSALDPALQAHQLPPRYTQLKFLSRGGMGVILSATDGRLERRVALKMVAPEFRGDTELVTRCQREAKALAAICSIATSSPRTSSSPPATG
ncbi:MAG: hypothetical protein HY815_29180 [Candidatus Riflebacteria bacterium]|nr:hypothetical protein [Candidatus Riflebacteria bacterium]